MAFRGNHGMSNHPIYTAWGNMKARCYRPSNPSFNNYGGRGITVCERWLKFENFRDDMFSTWQPGLQLDRIDVNQNYILTNCRWSTPSDNCKNKRNKSDKQSLYEGVYWRSSTQSWSAKVDLGSFEDEKEAAEMYQKVRELIKENS